jgi:hypothetical protein
VLREPSKLQSALATLDPPLRGVPHG